MRVPMSEQERENKAKAVQKALKGLDVEYMSHSGNNLTPDMAKVNGYSIVWHEYAYCAGEPDTVEVMLPDGDILGHLYIKHLRMLVS